MKSIKYLLYKDKVNKDIVYVEYAKEQKFEVKPKNAIDSYMDVDKLVIISPNFTKKIINKRVDNKLDFLINELVDLMEDDDSDDEKISLLIEECESFKMICISKYMAHLTSDELKEIFSKVDLIYDKLKDINLEKSSRFNFGRCR